MTPESAPELAPDRGWIARLGGEQVLLFLLAMVGLLCLLPMIAAPLDWQAQAALGLTLIVVATLANGITRSLWFTHFLMALSLFAMARYAWWRTTQSLGLNVAGEHWYDLVPRLLLYAAELYAWVVLVLGFLQTAMPLKRKPVPLPDDVDQWPGVDVFIPTYDEPLEVVRPTVLAALQMDWPRERLHVWLLDDGTRDDFRRFAEEVGAGYIIRSEHRHAKAGNLNHALGLTRQPFVAFFDSDHVPTRSFLQVTLGSFLQDAKLGLVQTPHHFYSPDPFERNLRVFKEVPNEGELFYGVVQDGNDLWDATFFCGSCAVMRREALDSIGGIAIGTVTEDAATSLKMQRVGWRSAYINVPQAAGLATESFSGHVGQRTRWARGMAQIMRTNNPMLGRGLQFMQRLCYLNAMLHFFFALPRLIFLTAPLFYLYLGAYVINAPALTIAAYAVPHLVLATIANARVQGRASAFVLERGVRGCAGALHLSADPAGVGQSQARQVQRHRQGRVGAAGLSRPALRASIHHPVPAQRRRAGRRRGPDLVDGVAEHADHPHERRLDAV
jgi:Glycosyltransferases, probably involved in cell wall biogenesis